MRQRYVILMPESGKVEINVFTVKTIPNITEEPFVSAVMIVIHFSSNAGFTRTKDLYYDSNELD